MEIGTGYVNIFVSNFQKSLDFYQATLGLPLIFADEEFRYASFATPGAQLAIVETDQAELVGRHTGIGLARELCYPARETTLGWLYGDDL